MSIDIHPENERARGLYVLGSVYDNMTPAILDARKALADAQVAIDEAVAAEYPIGTIVTVESVYHGARYIRGPVISHVSQATYHGAGLCVRNEKTGSIRKVDIRNFIFKEATA